MRRIPLKVQQPQPSAVCILGIAGMLLRKAAPRQVVARTDTNKLRTGRIAAAPAHIAADTAPVAAVVTATVADGAVCAVAAIPVLLRMHISNVPFPKLEVRPPMPNPSTTM